MNRGKQGAVPPRLEDAPLPREGESIGADLPWVVSSEGRIGAQAHLDPAAPGGAVRNNVRDEAQLTAFVDDAAAARMVLDYGQDESRRAPFPIR